MSLRVLDPLFCQEASGEIRDVLLERSYGPRLSTKTRLYYHFRPFIPIPVRQVLQHLTRPRDVPAEWYIDEALLALYARSVGAAGRFLVDLWPKGHRFAVALTHDVETEEGFRAIEPVARLEERLGVRSSWNIVARKYPIDHGYLRELSSRGFEVGVHGYNHDGTDFFSRRRFRRRIRWINENAVAQLGAAGYRSPAAHRNLEWLQDVNVEYDASVFDVDPFQPMPGGTKSIWPFVAGRLVELPYTLPQDHVLFVMLREKTPQAWLRKTDWLAARRGLVCPITHPDYLRRGRLMAHYEAFLDHARSLEGGWYALPRDVARWWRRRSESRVLEEGGRARVHGPAAGEAGLLRVRASNGGITFA